MFSSKESVHRVNQIHSERSWFGQSSVCWCVCLWSLLLLSTNNAVEKVTKGRHSVIGHCSVFGDHAGSRRALRHAQVLIGNAVLQEDIRMEMPTLLEHNHGNNVVEKVGKGRSGVSNIRVNLVHSGTRNVDRIARSGGCVPILSQRRPRQPLLQVLRQRRHQLVKMRYSMKKWLTKT